MNVEVESREIRKSHYHEIKKWKLKDKIFFSKTKIKEFIKHCEKNNINEITISFSGGKDSTVLLDLVVRTHLEMKSKIKLIPIYAAEITFSSTLPFIKEVISEYQKINKCLYNLDFKLPIMPWKYILEQKGFPIYSKQFATLLNRLKRCKTHNGISKMCFGIEQTARYKISKTRLFLLDDDMMKDHNINNEYKIRLFSEKCCNYVKGNVKKDKRPSFIGTMASESFMREKSWYNFGCNIFHKNKLMSRPLSIWTSENIWEYIKKNKILVNPAYNFDYNANEQNLRFERLGCSACPFGSSMEELIYKRKYKNTDTDEWFFDNSYKIMNRFEKLKEYSPALYKSQIWLTGMYKVLIDMNIKIRNDLEYKKEYQKRWKIIDEWYSDKNFKNNLLKVLIRIENAPNNNGWKYKLDEINKALINYRENPITKKELSKYRKKYENRYKNK